MLSKLLEPNRVKAALCKGHMAYGYNLAFPSPWVVDMLVSGWVSEMLLEAGQQMLRGKQS